jgi:hypothetical protein
MPSQVRTAIVLLWTAWVVSLCVMIVHSVQFPGPLLHDPGLIGWPAALLQALVIYFVGRRSNVARIVLVVVVALAIPGLLVLESLIFAKLFLAACATASGFTLRLIAAGLLFTPTANGWFRNRKVAASTSMP